MKALSVRERYEKAKELVAQGKTIAEASESVGMATPQFYRYRSIEKKNGLGAPQVIVHRDLRKAPSPKANQVKGADFVIITTPANLRDVLSALR